MAGIPVLSGRMKVKTQSKKVNKAWLNDHVNDTYVKLAAREGYRARAAYKLKEIDETLGLIRPGDLVVDPFGGSGTTAVAARNLGRRYITGDTDAGYCEIMRRRLSEPYTPQLFADEADAVDDAPRQVEMFEATP